MINVALVPLFDAADAFAVDAIVILYHHLTYDDDDDANEDALDDWPEFAFLLKFLAFDAADIYNPDALSYVALCSNEKNTRKTTRNV